MLVIKLLNVSCFAQVVFKLKTLSKKMVQPADFIHP